MESESFSYKPIGYLQSIFATKNGTPRQSGLSEFARASIRISKKVFTNPEHSLMNLTEFSHLWILWVFHQNTDSTTVKAKVTPPRLGGERVGVFSTRSLHRPNNLGLTLVKLESVVGDTVNIAGVDMVHGTPVLDIKPYIPLYDSPQPTIAPAAVHDDSSDKDTKDIDDDTVKVPQWIGDPKDNLSVIFSSRAESQLTNIDVSKLQWLKSKDELKHAIADILSTDPRSVYQKTKCSDRMYFTSLDGVHVTAWYDPDIDGMEVIKVKQEIS